MLYAMLVVGDTDVNKIDKNPYPYGGCILEGRQINFKNNLKV